MKTTILVLAAGLMLAGCARGPATRCDPCGSAVAKASTDTGAAAAASSKGGQEANQAPYSGEAGFRNDPSVSWNNGTGTNESNRNQNHERRATASGGAQNVAVNVPTSALATAAAAAGGKSSSVRMAERVIESLLTEKALMVARGQDTTQITADIKEAQDKLLSAEAGTRTNVQVHYHQDNQSNTLFGVSTSSTAGPMDKEIGKALAENAGFAAGSEFTSEEGGAEDDPEGGDDE